MKRKQQGDFDLCYPFSIFSTDPAHVPGKINGVSIAIMQSREYADEIIKVLKNKIDEGYNPNDIFDAVCDKLNINIDYDILESDLMYIKNEIDAYLKSI